MNTKILDSVSELDKKLGVVTLNAAELSEADFKRHFIDYNRPCLIKNALENWSGCVKWQDLGYLKTLCGDDVLTVYPHLNFTNRESMKADGRKVPLRDALEMLKANEGKDGIVSMPAVTISKNGAFSALNADMGLFGFLSEMKKPMINVTKRFFMYSGAGTGWHLHYFDETLMCQVVGAKKVGLIESTNKTFKELKQICDQDGYLKRDEAFYALVKTEKYYETIVEAGDALYIPPFWWHGIDPLDAKLGVTVAHCWRSPLHKIANISKAPIQNVLVSALEARDKRALILPALCIASSLAAILWRIKCFARFCTGSHPGKPY